MKKLVFGVCFALIASGCSISSIENEPNISKSQRVSMYSQYDTVIGKNPEPFSIIIYKKEKDDKNSVFEESDIKEFRWSPKQFGVYEMDIYYRNIEPSVSSIYNPRQPRK